MKSYIPKQAKQTRERLEAKLDSRLLRKLESYCEYLESDRDYVLSQALELVFHKDKGFAAWLSSREPKPFLKPTADIEPDRKGYDVRS
jgi:hypothetical protein